MRSAGAAQGARRAGRIALVGGVLLALAVRLAASAAAANALGTLSLSVSICQAGDTVTVTAAGLGGAGTVPIFLAGPGTSRQLGDATASAAGAFVKTVTIPPDTADGDYEVTTYDTAEALVTAPLHVGPPNIATETAAATDQGGDGATEVVSSGAVVALDASAAVTPDPYPVPEGVRDIAFVLLVAGSLALAAWGAGIGRPR